MQKICQIIHAHVIVGVWKMRVVPVLVAAALLCASAVCWLSISAEKATAQDIPDSVLRMRPSIGIVGGATLNQHNASFTGLPGVLLRTNGTTPILYGSASGIGFSLGIVGDLPLSPVFGISARLLYSSLGARLSAGENTLIGVLNANQDKVEFYNAKIGWGLTPTMNLVSAQLLGVVRPLQTLPDLRLYLGVDAGLYLSPTFKQSEQLLQVADVATNTVVSDPNATFNNLLIERNPQSGSLPTQTPQLSVLGGIGYDIPLTVGSSRVMLAPEVMYSYGLTPVTQGVNWLVSTLRAGVTVRFVIPEPPIPPPPPPPAPKLYGEILAFRVDSNGAEFPLIRLKVEEMTSKQLYPILPFVFFDQNNDSLAARYKRFQKVSDELDITSAVNSELTNFQNRFYNSDMMSVYYDVLNVIGKRLQDKPSARIQLTGCNDGLPGSEKGMLKLSTRRALAVRNYFRDVWEIDTARVKIVTRDLPLLATSSVDTLEGAEENRRVEITSADPSVLEPVLVFDTLSVCSVPKIRVRMKGTAEAGFERSLMRAFQGSKTLKEYRMPGAPEPVFDWNVQEEPFTVPKAEEDLNFELELYDKAGQKEVPDNPVPVEQLSLKRKKELKIKDKTVDVFRLISFPFNSVQMGKLNEEIVRKYVNPYLTKDSKVVATGYTDKLGKDDINQRLSDGRAKSIATSLKEGRITSLGVGSRRPLYSNDLPEGRFYNRTVEVRVETPVEYK